MVDVRIKDLPLDNAPNKNLLIGTDLATTQASTIENIVLAGRPTASQAEAVAGTDAVKAMTPLTTIQAISATLPSLFEVYLNNLPTTMPATVGSWWNNGGTLSQVQP